MGLDMYLTAERFLWNKEQQLKNEIKKIFPEIKDFEPERIEINVGYWRKANHIHKWFVDNVQNGEDDCRDYDVSRDSLLELKKHCEEIIIKPESSSDILPTQGGFFFGSTDYNIYYMDAIKETINIINNCLKLSEDWDFNYHSSW